MSTIPKSTAHSTPATPPAPITQPFVFILAPFELAPNFITQKQSGRRNEIAVTFEKISTTPSVPTIQPYAVDRISIRVLHGPDMPFTLPTESWIIERATDITDLRNRLDVLNSTASNWKAFRNHSTKREAWEDCTLAVRYKQGWVNAVADRGLGNPFIECVPVPMHAGEDVSLPVYGRNDARKRVKIVSVLHSTRSSADGVG